MIVKLRFHCSLIGISRGVRVSKNSFHGGRHAYAYFLELHILKDMLLMEGLNFRLHTLHNTPL